MKKILPIIILLISSFSIFAQDSTENIGRIYGVFKNHSYLADLLDTNALPNVGGIWNLAEYHLYDVNNTLVHKSNFWIGGGYSYQPTFDIQKLKLGKYIIKYWSRDGMFLDTMILISERPVIEKQLYCDFDKLNLKTELTVIEQLKNGDSMRISSNIIDMSGGDIYLMTIKKSENQYFVWLEADTIYSKKLTEKDIHAIKCFEWDARRDFELSCNDIGAIYSIEWKSYTYKIRDSCNEWNGYEMLKYLLFDKQ
jgi:hypothetical protein